ncbi:MAG: methionine--tRNA ligase subunit beta [Methanobacteriota archaeon]|nr:MAG: methionine--tRNA ligase subunit beta [Euryarchaeota archaeon]
MEGTIEYEDFAKLDIRVAKVMSAEVVGDKLIKMELSLGSETRTVVAGIRESYNADELVGKSVVMLYNLKPRKIRGIESQGMLLAADGEVVSLLVPDKEVSPGTKVM